MASANAADLPAAEPVPAAELRALRLQLADCERTIAALRAERLPCAEPALITPGESEQHLALQRLVAAKTRELDQERIEIGKALHELRSTQAQLLQAQKLESIGQLAAGIAHEINTPIQYIADNVGFIKRCFDLLGGFVEAALPLIEDYRRRVGTDALLSAADEAIRRAKLGYIRQQIPAALEQAIEGLQRVIVIISAMKQFSHPSQSEKIPVNLAELIRTTVTIARHEWKYVAEIETHFDEQLPAVRCHSSEISQVLLNLIVNASHAIADVISATPGSKGRISISTAQHDGYAEIRVSDTGAGIPEAIRARVFDPFFTTKSIGKGTGQGLAIAYVSVVEKHQGQISFESTVGVGTCFLVRLPLHAGPAPQADGPRAEHGP